VATTDDRPSDDPATTRHVSAMDVLAVRGTTVERRPDWLAGEEPMAIRAAGPGEEPVDVAITMRTPGGEAELAVGFLRTEGLIAGREDVLRVDFGDPAITSQPDDEVIVQLTTPFDASVVAERHFVANASCGICGKASLDDVAVRCDPIPAGRPTVDRDVIVALPSRLRDAQAVFTATGGLHAAGLFDPDGRLITLREDVGRHNALDKLVGAELLAGRLPLHDRVLLVSGRISFEIAQKAAVAGIPILCAVSAPSDLAVEVGRRLGMTVIGFLRGDGFNVYSGAERVAGI
jgi:FdhD protein